MKLVGYMMVIRIKINYTNKTITIIKDMDHMVIYNKEQIKDLVKYLIMQLKYNLIIMLC